VHEGKVVVDMNEAATRVGVRRGMLLREAKSFAPDAQCVPYLPEMCDAKRNEWLDIASLYTDEIQYVAPNEAFIELGKHPRPLEIAQLLLDHLERRFAYSYTAGLCPTHWVARSLVRFPLRDMPIAGLALSKESVQILTPLEPSVRERLIFLGYKRVRDVQNLPVETLSAQFGRDAYKILSAANGGLHEPVTTNYPAKRITETLTFVGGVADMESLKDALGSLSRALFAELSSQGFTAKDIYLRVALEDAIREVSAEFAKPFRGSHGLHTALTKLFLSLDLTEPVYYITVTLPGLSPANPRQRTLTGVPAGDTGYAEDSLESVRHKFGSYSVHQGKDHEEPRRVHVLRAWSRATGWQ
jgi:DNA polymerase IV